MPRSRPGLPFGSSLVFGASTAFLILCHGPGLSAQESTAPSPGPSGDKAPEAGAILPEISREDRKNFLTDKEALAPYKTQSGEISDLREVFALSSPLSPCEILWDPATCRLTGVLDTQSAPSPEKDGDQNPKESDSVTPVASPFLAEGPHPLSGTPGAGTAPVYFGFRIVSGQVEFLYTLGSLPVEEQIWLEDGGNVLQQRFSVPKAGRGLKITVPKDWEDRVEASAGTWKGATLTVPKEAAGEVLLTYVLPPPEDTTAPSN